MPEGSYPFPLYSGLLEPGHYNKIGSAIWLFLWCISSITKEKEDEEGVTWGIVLGNKPIKLSEIAKRYDVNEKTVSRWLDTLEDHHYIRVTRAARGLIIEVKNSKKWSDKNVRLHESDQTKMSDHGVNDKTKMSDQSNGDKTILSDHSDSDQTEMSEHPPFSGSDRTNMSDLKDIITTTPITTDRDWFEEEDFDPQANGMIAILNAYCKLHGKLDFHVKPREREAMGRMVAGGMPVPFTISTMESLLQAKRDREGSEFKYPTSFLYYVDGINEAWRNSQTTSPPMAGVAPGMQQQPAKRITKHQQALEDLRRRAREERQREQS